MTRHHTHTAEHETHTPPLPLLPVLLRKAVSRQPDRPHQVVTQSLSLFQELAEAQGLILGCFIKTGVRQKQLVRGDGESQDFSLPPTLTLYLSLLFATQPRYTHTSTLYYNTNPSIHPSICHFSLGFMYRPHHFTCNQSVNSEDSILFFSLI